MKTFLIDRNITGYEQWEVKAETKKLAIEKYNLGFGTKIGSDFTIDEIDEIDEIDDIAEVTGQEMNGTEAETVFDQKCAIVNDLHGALRATRTHPGIPLEKVANVIKGELDKAEIECLIRELKEEK